MKHIKYNAINWFFIITLIAGCSFGSEITSDSAIISAINYTGFQTISDSNRAEMHITALKADVSKESFPIIEMFNKPDSAWLVKFKNIIICPEDNYIYPGIEYPKEYNVFIDLHTGLLLKIISNFINDSKIPYEIKPIPDTIPIPPQVYHGIPKIPPKLKFYDLLGKGDCGKTPKSTQFMGIYINYSMNSEKDVIKSGWIFITGESPAVINGLAAHDKPGRVVLSMSIIDADTKALDLMKLDVIGVD